jgi:hypothetical protein
MYHMPNEIILDPLELDFAADAWAARDQEEMAEAAGWEFDLDVNDAVGPNEAKHAAELDRIMAVPIKANDPEYEKLKSARRIAIYAHHRRPQAVGPDEGFILPESADTYAPAPKIASGFAVERKLRRPK